MKTEVKITYAKASDYRLLPVTGAWGGPTITSEIVVDFYVDKVAVPDDVTLRVDPSGAAEQMPSTEIHNIREVMVGVVMRPDIALVIGNFLVEKANLVLKKTNVPTN